MAIKNEILYQMYLLLIFVVLGAVAIFAKLAKISLVEGESLRQNIEAAYVKEIEIPAEKGNIYAEDGSIMAASTPLFDIYMDFAVEELTQDVFDEGVDSLAFMLANYVDNQYTVGGWIEKLWEAYENRERYFLIRKNITYPELLKIKEYPIFNRGRYRGGFIAKQKSKRTYPFRMLARRTLGYVKNVETTEGEKTTKIGLEGFFDSELSGRPGNELMIKTSKGTWIPKENLSKVTPKRGADLHTTIDVNLQDAVQNALLRALSHHDADYGTAILMEVKTGAVKAISNLGRVGSRWGEIYNYGIGTATEPGSTFKLASMIALLEDGYVKLTDTVLLNEGITQFYEEEMKDASFHGLKKTTVKHAFEISSNVGVAKLVDRYYNHTQKGPGQFVNHLKDLYLHLPTGFEIQGEAAPFIKEPFSEVDQWSGTTLPWMAIGYESKLTPLQMLNLYNTVANNGTMMKPYIVSKIEKQGHVKKEIKPTIVKRRVITKPTLVRVQQMLEGVIIQGTGKKLKTDKYRFAGKTGTAQLDYKTKNKKVKHQASFVGYFPVENPQYSCIVLVNNPKQNGYYGSTVAGPVFREIADKCFALKQELRYPVNAHAASLTSEKSPGWQVGYSEDVMLVGEELNFAIDNQAADWAVLINNNDQDSIQLQNRIVSDDLIPDVQGMTLKDAIYLLENKGIRVRFKGNGRVKKQSIKSGTPAKGQTIYLRLS